jgi:hypothetical protein
VFRAVNGGGVLGRNLARRKRSADPARGEYPRARFGRRRTASGRLRVAHRNEGTVTEENERLIGRQHGQFNLAAGGTLFRILLFFRRATGPDDLA